MAKNTAQHELRAKFDPFFEGLHEGLKQIDRIVRKHEKQKAEAAKAIGKRVTSDRQTNLLKGALETLHTEVNQAEMYYKHIHWLQERFPEAKFEDVTGLCKLATPKEVEEQDYSLNSGRYVGVIIEEDGKTEEEFITNLLEMNSEISILNDEVRTLESILSHNISQMVEEDE